MQIDISVYEVNKKFILDWFDTKGSKDVQRTISMMAAALSIPCIAVAYYLGEHTNWHPDTIYAIARLKDFYGYTTIVGKPPGAPV